MPVYNYTPLQFAGLPLYFGGYPLIWAVNIEPDSAPAPLGPQDYAALLSDLLPSGLVWPREAGSTLQLFLAALAVEMARLHERSSDLVAEGDPRLTSELLPDWERVAGLPDPCVGAGQTLAVRRAALETRLTNVGGQSRAFFLEVASRLGYTITIDEFFSEAAAISAGIPYTGTSWAYTWRINSSAQTVRRFRAGSSTAGERVRSWGNVLLECVMNRLKPAHTVLLFAYA